MTFKIKKVLDRKIYFSIFLILTFHVVNLFAKDIQEDSWITFRTAFNIANYGQWSYNLGEKYSSTTSFFYPLLVAFIRSILHSNTIIWILCINMLATLLLSYLFVSVFRKILHFSRDTHLICFTLIATQPVSLLLSGKGMETVYLLLIFIISIWLFVQNRVNSSLVISGLLIFIRPDAIIFVFLLVLYVSLQYKRYLFFILTFFPSVILTYLYLNHTFTNSWLPQTITAKSASYDYSVSYRILHFFVRPQIETFAPITTKYVSDHTYIFIIVVSCIFMFLLLKNVFKSDIYLFKLLMLIFSGAVLPILIYGVSTSVFPWYTWPSRFLFQSTFIIFIMYLLEKYRNTFVNLLRLSFFFVYIVLSIFQVAISFNTGVRYEYRISIGKYLYNNAQYSDTLMLEPAGQIPYFAKLRTIDTVGLTSPEALNYMNKYPDDYLGEMFSSLKPNWVILSAPIDKVLTGSNLEKTKKNYILDRHFVYNPENFSSGLLFKIAKLGTLDDDLYLYKLIR